MVTLSVNRAKQYLSFNIASNTYAGFSKGDGATTFWFDELHASKLLAFYPDNFF